MLSCSFCGKGQTEVIKLIAGPAVYICDECVLLSAQIIEEENPGWYKLIINETCKRTKK